MVVSIEVFIKDSLYILISIGLQVIFTPSLWLCFKLLWKLIQYVDKVQNKKIDPVSVATEDQIMEFKKYTRVHTRNDSIFCPDVVV